MHKTRVLSSTYRIPPEIHLGGVPLTNSMPDGAMPAIGHIEMWLMAVGRDEEMKVDRIWYYAELVAMPLGRALTDDRAAMLGANMENSRWASQNLHAPRVRAVLSISAAALMTDTVLDLPRGKTAATLVPAGIFIATEEEGDRTTITSPMLSMVPLGAWERNARAVMGSLAFPSNAPESEWSILKLGTLPTSAEEETLFNDMPTLSPEQRVQFGLAQFAAMGILDASANCRNTLFRAISGRLTAIPAVPPIAKRVLDKTIEQTRIAWDFDETATPIPTPGIFNFHSWEKHHPKAMEWDVRPLDGDDPTGMTYIEWCEGVTAEVSEPTVAEGRLNAVFTQLSLPRLVNDILTNFCNSTDTWGNDNEGGCDVTHMTLNHNSILTVRDAMAIDADPTTANVQQLRQLAQFLEENGAPEQEIERVINGVLDQLAELEPDTVAAIRKREEEELDELRRLFGVGD